MNTDEEHMFPISVAIRDIRGWDTPGGAVTLDGNQVVAQVQTRFLTGLGIRGREDLQQSPVPPRFMHGDLIGSTMMETGPTGEVESSGGWDGSLLWQYTAFGEPTWPYPDVGQRSAGSGRYKYAGLYGYESGQFFLWGANEALPPILLSHVGERWYEPDSGRFVQRDPVGTKGGINVYAYCANEALGRLDPPGLGSDRENCPECGRIHCRTCHPPQPPSSSTGTQNACGLWNGTKPIRAVIREIRNCISPWWERGLLGKLIFWVSKFGDYYWLLEIQGDNYRPPFEDLLPPDDNVVY